MTPDDLLAALAAAADDDAAVREAVRACIKSVRDGTSVEHLEIAAILAPLAAHANARVRQEIADACDAFPEVFYDRVVGALEKDADHYVRQAVERAMKRRLSRKKERAKHEDGDRALATLFADIEAKDGKAARRRAERVMRLGIEQLVLRVDHELKRQRLPLENALSALDAEIARPTPARNALADRQRAVRERIDYEWAIFERVRGYATRVRPAFADELLGDVVDQARRQLLQSIGERASRVDIVVEIDHTLRVEIDRHALLQAIENVMKNAVEAYAPGARATVRVTARTLRRGAEVETAIADRGAGMNEATLAEIFVPFASKKPGGTGVGMGTVRKMIEDVHDGELSVTSAPGEGTIVTMVIPARRA